MEKEVGIKALRILNPPEQQLLQNVYNQVESHITKNKNKNDINWLNLYYNQATTITYDLQSEFQIWVNKIIDEVYSDWPKIILNSYGFIYNPRGSENSQKWHYDYSPTASTLFVTLTRTTTKNATQFLVEPVKKSFPNSVGNFSQDLEDFMDSEGVGAIPVAQVVCKQFCLLKVLPWTVHRGIGNGDDFDRVVFWITVDDHLHQALKEGYITDSSFYD